MLEFSLVAVPLLLLSVLMMEAAHWHVVRQLAYVALLDSARAGATQNGRRDVMEQAFAQAFLPRFVYAGEPAPERQRRAWSRIQRLTNMPAWWIEMLQPDDVHRLQTRLVYLHEPLTPLTRALLRQIAPSMGGCVYQAMRQGFLVMRLDLRIERHTPPLDWRTIPSARYDRVVYDARDCTD